MDHDVALKRLPDRLVFPAELRDKIHFDEKHELLTYRGPMSKREFETLWQLHPDSDYRRAIEELFRVATWDAEEQRQTMKGIWLTVAVTALFILVIVVVYACMR